MPFIDLSEITPNKIFPGIRIRTSHEEKLMLSYVEFEDGMEVPVHSHPHEQGGVVLEGRMELEIASETQVLEPGSLYLIPSNTPHRAKAVGGAVVVLDVFSPIREDYVLDDKGSIGSQ